MLDRLGLEPGMDYHESVQILADAKRANPALASQVEEAIAYALKMCRNGVALPQDGKRE